MDTFIYPATRKSYFSEGRSMDTLPPTQAALVEHIKRASYQAGHVCRCLHVTVANPNLPSPSEWGWVQTINGSWEVKWTELPEASQACRELIRSSCKKGCRSRRKCVKAVLQCTALCQCGGQCA